MTMVATPSSDFVPIECFEDRGLPVIRHPDNMHHDHLARLFRNHPHLRGTKVAALAESLRDAVVMGA